MVKDVSGALKKCAEEMCSDSKDIEPYTFTLTVTGKDATMVRALVAMCNEGKEQDMLLTTFRIGLLHAVKRLGSKMFGMDIPGTE